MIFVDSNVPMYVVGVEHPFKHAAKRRLDESIALGERLVTSAEVLQEILHRYLSINRHDAIQPAFDVLLSVVDDVLDLTKLDVMSAREIAMASAGLSARDALHVAVMRRCGISKILSFDAGFDRLPGIVRIGS